MQNKFLFAQIIFGMNGKSQKWKQMKGLENHMVMALEWQLNPF